MPRYLERLGRKSCAFRAQTVSSPNTHLCSPGSKFICWLNISLTLRVLVCSRPTLISFSADLSIFLSMIVYKVNFSALGLDSIVAAATLNFNGGKSITQSACISPEMTVCMSLTPERMHSEDTFDWRPHRWREGQSQGDEHRAGSGVVSCAHYQACSN